MQLFILTAIFVGCEHILEFEGEILNPKITVNALAVSDTIFVAGVAKSIFFTEVTQERNLESLYGEFVLDNAEIIAEVNNEQTYQMTFNSKSLNYESEYIPREGDQITLKVSAPGFKSVTAQTSVPKNEELTILETHLIYDKNPFSLTEWVDTGGADTLMQITAKIIDPPGKKNYYRLKIRSIAHSFSIPDGKLYYIMSDIYSSADVIFKDERLMDRYRGWEAGFSNIFDDSLFDGEEYEFTVETRKRFGQNSYVVVELQSITQELYNYLKSTMLYRITDQDSYTELIHIYSNIENGYGIFGSLNSKKHILYF